MIYQQTYHVRQIRHRTCSYNQLYYGYGYVFSFAYSADTIAKGAMPIGVGASSWLE